MKAIAVHPGTPNSMHLRDVDEPRLDEVAGERGVLVEVLRVGVDGTDKEINAAEHGDPPNEDTHPRRPVDPPAAAGGLIPARERLARGAERGDAVPSHIAPGAIVVAT